jgi:hypothetical protein
MTLWPLIGCLSLIAIAVLYFKGKEDAESFDGELRSLITRIRYCPVTKESFETFRNDFKRLRKMPGRKQEQIDVAFVEFKNKFREYFDEN